MVSEHSLTHSRRPLVARAQTKEQIVAAAAEVIKTCGLSGATTREIARAAGCAEGTIYKHFEDKETLFLTVLRERLAPAIAPIVELPRRAGSRTVRKNLEDTVRSALAFFSEMLPMMSSVFAHPGLLESHRKTMRERNMGPQRVVAEIATYFREEQRLGRVRDTASSEGAGTMLLGGCYMYAFIRNFLGEDKVPLSEDEFVTATVTTLMAGLDSQPQERK
jgi:AcrR family transcriptional regulator